MHMLALKCLRGCFARDYVALCAVLLLLLRSEGGDDTSSSE